MKKILFVCTGNTCRSPMAEMILKNIVKQKDINNVKISSAGIYAENGAPFSAQVAAVLKKNNCPRTAFKSKQITQKLINANNIVICMTQAHKNALEGFENVYTLNELTNCGDISDPYGCGEAVYQKCFDELSAAVNILAQKLF